MKIEDALSFASKSIECEQALKKDFEFCVTCPDKAYCPLSEELDGEEYYKTISAALEKQVPKETILRGMAPDGYWEVECPDCGARTSGFKNYPNYCGRCGQAQKWSE